MSVFNLKDHKIGSRNCKVGECEYIHAHWFINCKHCDGILHAIETDWSEYSFGHSGGHVFFETVCDSCGLIERDSNMESRKDKIDVQPLRFLEGDEFLAWQKKYCIK